MSGCNNGTVIPTNNDPLECNEFIGTDCIVYEQAIAYLGLPSNSSLTQVLVAMLASLVDARSRITNLENA